MRTPVKAILTSLLASAVLLAGACASTPAARIEANQELFDTYAPDVQTNLRAGKIALGYDVEMVRMALGEPDQKSTEVDASGETILWGYTRSRPGFSVGVGGGSFGGGAGMGGGVGMGSGPKRDYVAIISFREGRVTKAQYFD